jgi:hypothetical protein
VIQLQGIERVGSEESGTTAAAMNDDKKGTACIL